MRGPGFADPRQASPVEHYPLRHYAASAATAYAAETTLAGVYLSSPAVDGDAFEVRLWLELVPGTGNNIVRVRAGNNPLKGTALGQTAAVTAQLDGVYWGMWSVQDATIQGAAWAWGETALGLGTSIEDDYVVDARAAQRLSISYLEVTCINTGTATCKLDSGLIAVYHSNGDPRRAVIFDGSTGGR